MSSCSSLGVNAFRSSVQAAAHHFNNLTTPCARTRTRTIARLLLPLPAAPRSTRCFSSWPSAQQQQPQARGAHGRSAVAGHAVLSIGNVRPILSQSRWLGVRTILGGGQAVITHYVDLPPSYTDRDGLPFAKRDLDAAAVIDLFGLHLGTAEANRLLKILHGRRVAGTLDDPSLQINTIVFNAGQKKTALEYLRKHLPVDEVANAGLRAEDELAVLEQAESGAGVAEQPRGTLGYAIRSKLFKDAGLEPNNETVHKPGAFDVMRERNKAKWEAELKRREEAKKKQEEEESHGKAGPLQVAGKQQTRQLSAKMQQYMVKGQSDLKEPPKMAMWQRLLPSTAFVLALCGLCVAYAYFYQPAKRADRLFPDIPPAAATVATLILANLACWGLWKIPPMWRFLNQHFMLVAATPRASTMLTAMFSHQSALHLAQNMAILWFMGVRLHDEVGQGAFLATYFASGAVGALGTLTWAVMRNRMDVASLGASGAIYGIGAAYLWLHRFESFRILGLPPPPREGPQGLTLLAVAAALNIGAIFTAQKLTVDITGHLVGLCVGIVAAHMVERGRATKAEVVPRATEPTKA